MSAMKATHYCLTCREDRVLTGDVHDLTCERCGSETVSQDDDRAVRSMFGLGPYVKYEGPFDLEPPTAHTCGGRPDSDSEDFCKGCVARSSATPNACNTPKEDDRG